MFLNYPETVDIHAVFSEYDIWPYFAHFRTHNKTPFIDSYHGDKHVIKVMNSILSVKDECGLSEDDVRILLVTAIFHDFNYVGIDFSNPNYDAPNLEAAEAALRDFLETSGFAQADVEFWSKYLDLIIGIIRGSYYRPPERESASFIDDCSGKEFWHEGEFERLRRVFYACDHSMLLYRDYPEACLNMLTREAKMTEFKEMWSVTLRYFSKVSFEIESFQKIWMNTKVITFMASVRKLIQHTGIKIKGITLNGVSGVSVKHGVDPFVVGRGLIEAYFRDTQAQTLEIFEE